MELTAATPVGDAMATWAYRLLLDRDPETPQVLANWAGADLATLREGLLNAPEFAGRVAMGYAPGPASPMPVPAITMALALRDGAWPPAAEVARWEEEAPDLDRLRREVLAGPGIEDRVPVREGLRRRTIRLSGRSFTLAGDSRDPEFATAPGPAPTLVAACRALWPAGGQGRLLVDSGAGIGLGTLALAVGVPRYARLLAYEETLTRAALLAANIRTNEVSRAEALAIAAPEAAALATQEGPKPDLIRLAGPDAVGQALRAGPALRAAGCAVLMRFDLRSVLLTDRLDPRAALRGLGAAFPGAAILADPAAPRGLSSEGDLDAALEAALDGAQDVVLAAQPDWIARYTLA